MRITICRSLQRETFFTSDPTGAGNFKKYKMNYFKMALIGITLLASNIIKAQVSVNINIGSPPEWGPIGYTEVRYYYLPDVEAYYDIQTSMFIYYGNGGWLHEVYLPARYRSYDCMSSNQSELLLDISFNELPQDQTFSPLIAFSAL